MKNKKALLIKILVEASRILLGCTFLFSGFVKAVDPFGGAYKIKDYLTSFHLSSLSFLALPISGLLSATEFIMGAFMLLGIYRRWNSRLILLMMCFMTPLTLYLALANPVEDCGCFGDFLIISNWETFFKNIVLLAAAIMVLCHCEHISNFFTGKTYWLAFLHIILFICGFIGYNYLFDPLFDFRAYTPGANIAQLMTVEEGKGSIEENIFVYEKDGIQKVFTEDNYPWEDSTWVFVKMDTKVIKEGEKPKINDFTINKLSFNKDMTEVIGKEDITNSILTDTNYVFLMISPSLTDMNMSYLSNFEDVAHYAKDYQYESYCLTSSVTDDIMAWEKEQVSNFTFCLTDERTLKTIIRTNPGLLLLKDGVIINKWADIRTPAEEDLYKPIDELGYNQIPDTKAEDKKHFLYLSAIFVVPLLTLKLLDLLFYRKQKTKVLPKKNETEDKVK